VTAPGGETVLVMVNHLKSKGGGSQASSNEKRKRQARQIRNIYDARRAAGVKNIAIVGDFNDTPDSDPLAPLLKEGSDLKDVSLHPKFTDDGRPGTYKNGTKGTKIDYILLSPALFGRVTKAAYHRTGVWGGKNGDLWPVYDTMERDIHAASDHAAVWADIDI
jgi:predicted extracellular nuclease